MKEPRNDAGLYTLTRTNTLDTNQRGASAGVSRALQLGDGEPGNEVCADRSLASVQNCSQRRFSAKRTAPAHPMALTLRPTSQKEFTRRSIQTKLVLVDHRVSRPASRR